MHENVERKIRVLLIVPPFGPVIMPSLALHLLQAQGRRAGFHVAVLYANLIFAKRIGCRAYASVVEAPRSSQLGARIFARHAFDLTPIGDDDFPLSQQWTEGDAQRCDLEGHSLCYAVQSRAHDFCAHVATSIARERYDIVGCTTTFEQTHAALAILRAVKRESPQTVTLIGGANCEGEMANALADITPMVDYVFSGEAEQSFMLFLQDLESGVSTGAKVVRGRRVDDLDALPCPDFSEYFCQISKFLPQVSLDEVWLSYETSRGCWWGQKHHCTFCGLNGSQIAFRSKAVTTVERDLGTLLVQSPVRKVCMTDNIMPWHYHNTLIPRLAQSSADPILIFYEQKSNLTLTQMARFAQAGVRVIQPGIESLSTRLLRRIKKGTTAPRNIAALRYAAVCEVSVIWNLLSGIPGETEDDYLEMAEILPWIIHLEPPRSMSTLSIDRFSPYFQRPGEFGIRNVQPLAAYKDVFPAGADLARVAYHFSGEYESCAAVNSSCMRRFRVLVNDWRARWRGEARYWPKLEVVSLGEGQYLLIDTRRQDRGPKVLSLTKSEARTVLLGTHHSGFPQWALDNHFALTIDGAFVPLAVTDKETFRELEATMTDSAKESMAGS